MRSKKCLYTCLLTALVLFPTLFFLSPFTRPPSLHKFTGLTMGTSYSVLLNAKTLPLPRPSLQARFDAILKRVNGETSTYLPESELSRINAVNSTAWLDVSPSLMQVLQAARHLSRLTQGAFDVSIAPLTELWGFGPGQDFTVPGQEQIARVLPLVDHEKLQLDVAASRLKKAHGDISLDLSAIAKGYAVDRLAEYLEQLRVANYLVEIGGEIRARGVNDKRRPWQIGIEQPVIDQRAVRHLIQLENTAMATSGDYRNFFERDGRRYSHVIDPRNGRPISHELVSVTVLHPSTMLADAWATALLVLGPETGYELAAHNGLAAYFIMHDNEGFRDASTQEFQRHQSKAYNQANSDLLAASH